MRCVFLVPLCSETAIQELFVDVSGVYPVGTSMPWSTYVSGSFSKCVFGTPLLRNGHSVFLMSGTVLKCVFLERGLVEISFLG